MKKNHISIVLIFLLGLKITAQEKIIKQQSGHCYLAGDEHMPCILKKYDKNGKIILDENNNYAISVKYTYDKKGREILKEAMYGETSSETKTVYSKNEIVKIERSPYYFNKIVIYNDDNGYILSKTVYYSSNYEKRIEEHTFKYKNTEYLVKHTIKTKYLEKGTHYKEIYDIAEKEIIEELEGLKAVKVLSAEGIKTNVTLVFSQNQVLIAAKAGASYISPFIGRLMDNGQDEIDMLKETMEIIRAYNFKSEIIVASVRNTRHVIEAAKMGAHIATIPFGVLEKMFKHPNTDQGLEAFLKDWEKLQEQLKK